VRLQNLLAKGRTGGWTSALDTGEVLPIFDVAESAQEQGIGLVVLAGKMYGSGSSRDWAAKGPLLQGVRAVIAESFERIHRSNLVQMGVIPLQFQEGEGVAALGLDGTERYDVSAIDLSGEEGATRMCTVCAHRPDGTEVSFRCHVRIDTPTEAAFVAAGGILPYVLDQLAC
jgi:aconitate hydratase